MNAILLIVSVGVEYPALLSTVIVYGIVGFILRLKAQVFSLSIYNSTELRCMAILVQSTNEARRRIVKADNAAITISN